MSALSLRLGGLCLRNLATASRGLPQLLPLASHMFFSLAKRVRDVLKEEHAGELCMHAARRRSTSSDKHPAPIVCIGLAVAMDLVPCPLLESLIHSIPLPEGQLDRRCLAGWRGRSSLRSCLTCHLPHDCPAASTIALYTPISWDAREPTPAAAAGAFLTAFAFLTSSFRMTHEFVAFFANDLSRTDETLIQYRA